MKTKKDKSKKPKLKEIVIHIAEDYKPEEGDAFEAVVAALDYFDIKAFVFERDRPE